ncbi:MAG: TetR family transcriptional regulator [Alphaproteobacteria bacterium]|nr:TetR family transcriptional regulator [Alphaproteobacteria bacterium]MDD9919371.1 TetR family transcriptional regulator [Alphaproteobacteria bacterium]
MSVNPAKLTTGQLKILQAVATLLENPSQKITINRLAKEIHVTDGAIYRHYRSKDDIFEALLGYMEANLLTPLNVVQKQSSDTYRRLEIVFGNYMEFLSGHPGLARLLLGHGATEALGVGERIKLLNSKLRAQVAQILKFGQAQGVLKENVKPEQATELFYGLIVAAAMAQAYDMPQVGMESRWQVFSQAVFKKS